MHVMILCEIIIFCSIFKILLQNGLLELSFKSKLQVGIPFYWTFSMNKSSDERVSILLLIL